MSSVVYNTKSNGTAQFFPTKMLKYQNIAPAPAVAACTEDAKMATRKYTPRLSNGSFSVDQTQSVQRRNARERNRVKQVNNSFARLRQHIPQTIIADLTKGGGRGPHKKISKVDTLRIAVEYIRRLQDLVDDLNGNCSSNGHSVEHSLNAANAASDTASNSSFSSSSSGSSVMSPSPTPADQMFYANVSSPLSDFQLQGHVYQTQLHIQAELQHLQQQQQQPTESQTPLPAPLLTPISLAAYSSLQQHQHQQQQLPQTELGCHSPTSSFNSSVSFDSGTFEAQPQQLSPPHNASLPNSTVSHIDAHLQLKFEPYNNFSLDEEDCTPDDEEILDYISLWQEQQN